MNHATSPYVKLYDKALSKGWWVELTVDSGAYGRPARLDLLRVMSAAKTCKAETKIVADLQAAAKELLGRLGFKGLTGF